MLGEVANVFGSGIFENILWMLWRIPGMPGIFLKAVIVNLWSKKLPKVYEINFLFPRENCAAGIAGKEAKETTPSF